MNKIKQALAGVAYRGRFPGAPCYVLYSLCNDLCQEPFLKWPRLWIYFPYYWAEMVMAEMVLGRNGSGPKMNSHSDEFILKFASVSEFHRHKTRRSKNEDAIFVFLNFYTTLQKSAGRKAAPRFAPERLFETYRCIAKCCKTFQSAPAMQRTPVFKIWKGSPMIWLNSCFFLFSLLSLSRLFHS